MIDQIAISVISPAALALSMNRMDRVRRWSPIVGLCGQPFWFYMAIVAHQWGAVFITTLYTSAWAYGIYTHWWRRAA